ncbi:MAG: circadian clock protein KaiB [Bacteroidetes bacterium]|jgi:circadian clock protein KaiB|nr:circadian clock protein KaiB [Bacteroidota bacterium]MBT6686190.1 circadian clock protein KaiB [Bacteroidota bacterium]MBT7143901.1 circadian clock protein KaiB [Bacteroidota bacterium]MBT7491256.1 circadian clock protein KaiB [Bacteroidota bacterium]
MSNYKFKLYVVESNVKTSDVIKKIKEVFSEVLNDNYSLEIVDILNNPDLAIEAKILASPTLIMEFPLPSKRVIGKIADTEKLFARLKIVKE